jgi:hypothetical protein
MVNVDAAMIAQGPLEAASRYRGPPLTGVRENASDFDCHSAYLSCISRFPIKW